MVSSRDRPPERSLVHIRKPPKVVQLADFVPWTSACFATREARDEFVRAASSLPPSDVEVEPMQNECRCASVRWRPGSFLGLNDVAHAFGGRIATAGRR
jgi:hypothetical protein